MVTKNIALNKYLEMGFLPYRPVCVLRSAKEAVQAVLPPCEGLGAMVHLGGGFFCGGFQTVECTLGGASGLITVYISTSPFHMGLWVWRRSSE